MAIDLDTILESVNLYLGYTDSNILTEVQKSSIIADAVEVLSNKIPREIVEAYDSNTTGIYDLPLYWYDGISNILEVESPVNQSPKSIIRSEYYTINSTPDGDKILFAVDKPSGTFWVKYTTTHTIDSNNLTTISDIYEQGFTYLCLSLICKKLANFYSAKADPSLSEVEIVAYPTRSEEFISRSREWLKAYNDEIADNTTGVYCDLDFSFTQYWNRDLY